jgi:hypothetical protein
VRFSVTSDGPRRALRARRKIRFRQGGTARLSSFLYILPSRRGVGSVAVTRRSESLFVLIEATA